MAANNETIIYIGHSLVEVNSRKKKNVPYESFNLLNNYIASGWEEKDDDESEAPFYTLTRLEKGNFVYVTRRYKNGKTDPMWIESNGDNTYNIYSENPIAVDMDEFGLTGRIYVVSGSLKDMTDSHQIALRFKGRFGRKLTQEFFPADLDKGDIIRYTFNVKFHGTQKKDAVFIGHDQPLVDKGNYIEKILQQREREKYSEEIEVDSLDFLADAVDRLVLTINQHGYTVNDIKEELAHLLFQ